MRLKVISASGVFFVALVFHLVPTLALGQACAGCHSQGETLPGSAHASLECTTCHSGREEFPHAADATTAECAVCHSSEADQTALGVHGQERQAGNEAAPDCGVCHGDAHQIARPGTTPFRRDTIETCGMCHSTEADEFRQSVHGQAVEAGNREAPVCSDCHGEHAIQRPSSALTATGAPRIRETCAGCHGNLRLMARFGLPTDRVVSFNASFHGLAGRAGSQTVADCGSCHGIHNILPSSNPDSTINPANLPKTCGSCHPGAGSRFALGPIHVVEGEGQVPIADFIRRIYLVLIPLVIGLMLSHNVGDWVRKVRKRLHGAATPAPPAVLRMLPAERWQHGLLVISFVVLAWTGFALKFPDRFWAYPLVAAEAWLPVRGWVHRIAAVVFVATSVAHLITLLVSPRLRDHWRHLLPLWRDVREAVNGFCFNVGLRKQRPEISEHSYVEKAEYWAVVWGAVLMSLSGVVLWANNFFLAYAPKALLDIAVVVHYYEAILAVLAIFVWHFYFVIFDPAVYPMSMAWLTGYGPAKPSPETASCPVPAEPAVGPASGVADESREEDE